MVEANDPLDKFVSCDFIVGKDIVHNSSFVYIEAKKDGKLASALQLARVKLPPEYSLLFPNDQYCWKERVDTSNRFRGLGIATSLLEYGDKYLAENEHIGELRMFEDLSGNGFNNYLAKKRILLERGNKYFWRIE